MTAEAPSGNTPFFTVVMPAYNRGRFLHRSIGSVIAQDFADWELVVVDDGSTDDTRQVVEDYGRIDGRIRPIFQSNQKASAARNNGIVHARGRYLCFLDSDDAYHPDHLSSIHSLLAGEGFPDLMVCMQFEFVDEVTGFTKTIRCEPLPEQSDVQQRILSVFLPYSPPVQTICHPNRFAENILFDRSLQVDECYDYCARVAALYPVRFVQSTTVTLYGHHDNISVKRTPKGMIDFYRMAVSDFLIMSRKPFFREIRRLPAFKDNLQSLSINAFTVNLKEGRLWNAAFYLRLYLSVRPISIFGFLMLKLRNSGLFGRAKSGV